MHFTPNSRCCMILKTILFMIFGINSKLLQNGDQEQLSGWHFFLLRMMTWTTSEKSFTLFWLLNYTKTIARLNVDLISIYGQYEGSRLTWATSSLPLTDVNKKIKIVLSIFYLNQSGKIFVHHFWTKINRKLIFNFTRAVT